MTGFRVLKVNDDGVHGSEFCVIQALVVVGLAVGLRVGLDVGHVAGFLLLNLHTWSSTHCAKYETLVKTSG